MPGMIALADAAPAPLGLVDLLCDVREAALVHARMPSPRPRWPIWCGSCAARTAGPVPRHRPEPTQAQTTDIYNVGGRPWPASGRGRRSRYARRLLMIGPPGSGKTMLAERLAGLLPAGSRPPRP